MKIPKSTFLLLVLGAVPGACLLAQPASEKSIELAPFVVNEAPEGLPWQYAQVGDFEVLTLCSEPLTWQFVQAQWRGWLFLPEDWRGRRSAPVQVVLWGGKVAPLPPTRKYSYRSSGRNFGTVPGWFIPDIIADSDRDHLLLSANFKSVGMYESVAIHYARRALHDVVPAPPRWLEEGFSGNEGLFPGDLGIQGMDEWTRGVKDYILLPKPAWKESELPDQTTRLIPLGEFFTDIPSAEQDAERHAAWCYQAGLFIRWALYGPELNARQDALWRFARRASVAPVTEEMFRAAFGLGFAEAETRMREYLADSMNARPTRILVPGLGNSLPAEREFRLRPASETEVARLKGNFERMEMNRLRVSAPADAAKYEVAVRRTLKRGLHYAPDDPSVHELAGLVEYETGHAREAGPHLEFAFGRGAAGSRALLALARLRLDDERGSSPPNGRLSAEAVERVLTPLFAARERRPAIAETYHLIAEVWSLSAVSPRPAHLAALLEGVNLFPEDEALRQTALALHRRYGFQEETRQREASMRRDNLHTLSTIPSK